MDELMRFMTEEGFSAEDRDVLCGAYHRIMAIPAARERLEAVVSMYQADIHCDYKQILSLSKEMARIGELHPYTVDLLCFLCLIPRAKEVYAARGLSEELFYHTMADLRYKLEECRVVKGICGSFVAHWFPGFFELKRFAFGRLQLETKEFGATYEKNGVCLTPDSTVLNAHIPRSGERLDEGRCLEAFAEAKEFFKDRLGDTPAVTCHSWILFPKNRELLPSSSNLVKFMNLFDIYDWHYTTENQDLWRFFDTDEQNPNRLPTDSSLRRAYVEYLKQGGRCGSGCGIRLL